MASRLALGGSDGDQAAGEWICTKIITDAINPQYGDRVRPPVSILWQMLKEPMPEKHLPFPPTAPKTTMRNDSKTPIPKAPPKTPGALNFRCAIDCAAEVDFPARGGRTMISRCNAYRPSSSPFRVRVARDRTARRSYTRWAITPGTPCPATGPPPSA